MPKLTYRPAIDGIRAIAIISVFIFHLNNEWLPGGFLGVDIFFVLSGYLITAIILINIEIEEFSLLKFYQRRIARIFPAFAVVSIFIFGCSSLIYNPHDFASTGAAGLAAALSIANIKYMIQGNYFDISVDAQPFLHYWSLSVEEQFYLIFPLLLLITAKYKHLQKLFGLMAILAIISFSFSIYLYSIKPTWAFYLLPTRAWELLSGCGLAVFTRHYRSNPINLRLNNIIPLAGLIIIIASLFMINEDSLFPVHMILPVIGTLLIIGFSTATKNVVEELLSYPPLTYIGKISYSLYLWHWPIFSFIDYSLYSESDSLRLGLKVLFSFSASIVSYHYLEHPLRNYLNIPNKKIFAYMAFLCLSMAIVVTGYNIRKDNYISVKTDQVKDGGFIVNHHIGNCSIILMGDSNGSMYAKSLVEIAKQMNLKIQVITVDAADALPPSILFHDSIKLISEQKPDIVFLSTSWTDTLKNNFHRLDIALREIEKESQLIILTTKQPRLPEYASRQGVRKEGLKPIFEDSNAKNVRIRINDYIKSRASKNVFVFDLSTIFIKENNELYFTDKSGHQLYDDSNHLSKYGADLVVREIFFNTLQKRLPDNSTVKKCTQ